MSADKNNGRAIVLAKMFSEFLGTYDGKRSVCTITGYRTAMKLFASFAQQRLEADVGHFDITYFSEQNVSLYLEWLQDKQGASPQTCNLRLCQIRAFLKYASKDPDIMPYYLSLRKIERYITENRTKVVGPLSKNAITALMKTPGTGTETGLRYTTLMAMLYEHLSVSRSDTAGVLCPPYTVLFQSWSGFSGKSRPDSTCIKK